MEENSRGGKKRNSVITKERNEQRKEMKHNEKDEKRKGLKGGIRKRFTHSRNDSIR